MSSEEKDTNSDAGEEFFREAGWYPAPFEVGFERWWDGEMWTEKRREAPEDSEDSFFPVSQQLLSDDDMNPVIVKITVTVVAVLLIFTVSIAGLFFLSTQVAP